MPIHDFATKAYTKYLSKIIPFCIAEFISQQVLLMPGIKKKLKILNSYYEEKRETGFLDSEIEKPWKVVNEHPLRSIPYAFYKKYIDRETPVYRDTKAGMYYVVHADKKLYFKREMPKQLVKKCYNALCAEQDLLSPHRYLSSHFHMFGEMNSDGNWDGQVLPDEKEFTVFAEDVVADIGSAEGNFAVSVVDKVKKLVVFEYDEEWLRCLEKTLAPYAHKTEIVRKYVSDKTEGNTISIDDFCQEKGMCFTFLKADVEGSEMEVLKGAQKCLQKPGNTRAAFCTYHYYGEPEQVSGFFQTFKYETYFTKGYINPLVVSPPPLFRDTPPYFRETLIRATKW